MVLLAQLSEDKQANFFDILVKWMEKVDDFGLPEIPMGLKLQTITFLEKEGNHKHLEYFLENGFKNHNAMITRLQCQTIPTAPESTAPFKQKIAGLEKQIITLNKQIAGLKKHIALKKVSGPAPPSRYYENLDKDLRMARVHTELKDKLSEAVLQLTIEQTKVNKLEAENLQLRKALDKTLKQLDK